MGSQDRRARQKEEVRGRILDAARELFAEQGVEAVSMRKIADRIDYTATALYFHFRDKESLLRELCANDFLAFTKRFMSLSRVQDPIERLRGLGEAYVEFAVTHPHHFRLMFMTPRLPSVVPEGVHRGNPQEDVYAFLRETVREGVRQGRFRKDLRGVEVVTQTVWAAVHGVAALEIANPKDDWVDWAPLRARVRLMIDTLFRGMAR
ncbi:MAG: TetR/AcrR family transcriptional regulator [Planctomycetota bacterium]